MASSTPPIGSTGMPYVVPVERGKVREFAQATRARTTGFRDDPDAVIPPTWLAAGSFWAEPASLALGQAPNLERTLHGGQEFVFHGSPPRVGDVLTAQQRVAERYTKDGRRGGSMEFTVLVTEYRDPTGRLVAEARMTLIETSRAAG